MEVEGKAIAEVYAGGGASAKCLAECKAWLKASAPRFAKASGDVEQIAGTSAAAKERFPAGGRSADHYVAVNLVAVREVTASEDGSAAPGESHETAIEGGDELASVFGISAVFFTIGANLAPRLFGWIRAPLLVALTGAFSSAG